MASNYTENIGLCQWAAEDAVLREDFNADNQKLEAALSQMPRMVMGSYVGTGTYGADAPNSLTFDIQPLLVIIVQDSGTTTRPGALFLAGQTASAGFGSISASAACMEIQLTWNGNSLSWYAKESASDQLNSAEKTFYYLALGN